MYGFVDPNRIAHNTGKAQKRVEMLADAMKEAIEDKIFLAPYNSNSYWALVAIDSYANKAYFMDPLGRRHCPDVRVVLKLALTFWAAEKKLQVKAFKLDIIKAPFQPGAVECEFYVMRFMKDITEMHILSITEKAFEKKTYAGEEINSMRNEWASYVRSLLKI